MKRRRPTAASMRVRRRNIIEGMGTGDLRYDQMAFKLGVTPPQLKKFLEARDDRVLAKGINRSPTTRKLYEAGARANVRTAIGKTRIRKYRFKEHELNEPRLIQRYPNSKQIGRMIQRMYYENGHERINWSVYTYEHNLPNSIDAIRLLYHNGKISKSQYRKILKTWRDIYGSDGSDSITDEWFAEFYDEVEEVYDEGE